ncbi:MAG TPA: hypothetical protein VNV62_03645 [Trebonia sp.]|nr:hypothetical protein [Trebonia sp.]
MVTSPDEVVVAGDVLVAGAAGVAGAEVAAVAGGEVAGWLVPEFELAPELHAAIPATRQVARATARHREPDSVNDRISAKRLIARSALPR